jgi:phage terminase small subunit
MAKNLSDKQKMFIEQYISNGFNATKAYAASYPDCKPAFCQANGSRLKSHPRIQEAIIKRMEEVLGPQEELSKRLLVKLNEMAFADKKDEYYVPTVQTKAIELIGKQLGVYVQKIETKNDVIEVHIVDDDDED